MINFGKISTVFGFARVRICYFVRFGSIIWFIWFYIGLYKVVFEVFASSKAKYDFVVVQICSGICFCQEILIFLQYFLEGFLIWVISGHCK